MIGRDDTLNALRRAISGRKAGQIEVLSVAREAGCTRYANSAVHQNVHEKRQTAFVRVIDEGRIGLAKVPSLGEEDISEAVRWAREAASLGRGDGGYRSFPPPQRYAEVSSFSAETAGFDHHRRADLLSRIFREAKGRGVEMAGAMTTGQTEIAVANSNGLAGYSRSSFVDVTFTALREPASGYAGTVGVDADEDEISRLADRAMDKALVGGEPVRVPPGRYTVILEPKALAELLEWTTYIAFGAKTYQDGTSFMAGKIGERIVGENITIYDDGLEPIGLPIPFDYEGTPKGRRDIIREGRAVGVAYDSVYAAREGKTSTGNATLPDSDEGPLPLNVFMEAGDLSREDLISSTPRGLLVTRFHYVNGLLETGMTRDGTFLIEDGVVKSRVEELRFTDSVLRMLNHVSGISRERESVKSWWSDEGVYTVPTVRIEEMAFTGGRG